MSNNKLNNNPVCRRGKKLSYKEINEKQRVKSFYVSQPTCVWMKYVRNEENKAVTLTCTNEENNTNRCCIGECPNFK